MRLFKDYLGKMSIINEPFKRWLISEITDEAPTIELGGITAGTGGARLYRRASHGLS